MDKGLQDHGNLSVRTGKGGGRWRILRCCTCRTEFSERMGTALFRAKMSAEKIIDVAKHLKEGCGIRKTSRLTGASKDGVTSVAVRLGGTDPNMDNSAQLRGESFSRSPYAEGKSSLLGLGAPKLSDDCAPPKMKKRLGQMLGELVHIWFRQYGETVVPPGKRGRPRKRRKRRKTYEFSKDLAIHIAVSWWVVLCYNVHHLYNEVSCSTCLTAPVCIERQRWRPAWPKLPSPCRRSSPLR